MNLLIKNSERERKTIDLMSSLIRCFIQSIIRKMYYFHMLFKRYLTTLKVLIIDASLFYLYDRDFLYYNNHKQGVHKRPAVKREGFSHIYFCY